MFNKSFTEQVPFEQRHERQERRIVQIKRKKHFEQISL